MDDSELEAQRLHDQRRAELKAAKAPLEAEIERLRAIIKEQIEAFRAMEYEGSAERLEYLLTKPEPACPIPGCTRTDTHVHDSIGQEV